MASTTQVIDSLKAFEFHDVPVESIELKTENAVQLILILLVYNESDKNYDRVRLSFVEVKKLETSSILLSADSSFEILDFDYKYDGGFFCRLSLLQGVGEPSFTVELMCENIIISSG